MPSETAPQPVDFATTLRVLVGALCATPLVFALALLLMFSGDPAGAFASPNINVVAVQVVVAGALAFVMYRFEFPAKPLASGLDEAAARRAGVLALQTIILVRFAAIEALIVGSLAAAFMVTSGNYLTYLLGGLAGVALVWFFCWPSQRNVGRFRKTLESDGARSYLDETFGVGPTVS